MVTLVLRENDHTLTVAYTFLPVEKIQYGSELMAQSSRYIVIAIIIFFAGFDRYP